MVRAGEHDLVLGHIQPVALGCPQTVDADVCPLDVEIDAAFIGIGENCHVAFNDPPADFDTEAPYIVVDLDEACRRQQWGG